MKQKIIMDAAKHLIDKHNHINVNENNTNEINYPVGDYYIINYDEYNLINNNHIIEKQIIKVLKTLLKKHNLGTKPKILIIGLGNSGIIADSFGTEVTNKLIATYHYEDFITLKKIAIFNPNITNKTGIDSLDVIKMINEHINPDILLFIDSMQTNDVTNINKIIEINDHSIIPGSYLNTKKEINYKTFNKPIISIGIPLVYEQDNIFLTLPNINEIIEINARLVANAINKIILD